MHNIMCIPIFIPHNGCPNDCVFCNQRKISGTVETPKIHEIRNIIDEALETADDREVEIAFFGGSFTGLDMDLQKEYLDLAAEYVDRYHLRGIRFSTRPDYINEEVMDLITQYPVVAVELGIQSMDPDVLAASKRNHTVQDVYDAVELIRDEDIELGVQMMLGLPGDTEEKAMNTCMKLLSFEPATVRIYPTLVIEGTELAKMYEEKVYEPISLEEAVRLTARIMPPFVESGVDILRVGLHDNEELRGASMLAGPYHPAFRELVMDEIIYNKINEQISQYEAFQGISHSTAKSGNTGMDAEDQVDAGNETAYELVGGKRIYQRLVGHKKRNQERLIKKGILTKKDDNLDLDTVWLTHIEGGTVFTGVL